MDRAWHLTWDAGQIITHASSQREARAIALEYLLAQGLIKAQEASQDEPDKGLIDT